MFEVEIESRRVNGEWLNLVVDVVGWNWISPTTGKPKRKFRLGYHLAEKRWAEGKDYQIAREHGSELIDQVERMING